jgi:anti-sigma factor RsiW
MSEPARPTPPRPVQEDELHGFVDGRLTAERHAEIALLLRADPALAQRLEEWSAQQALLRAAMAAKAREPVPPALHLGRLIDARLARRAVPWRMAAGFALCLAVGGAAGWWLRADQRPDDLSWLTRQAASAHRVFATDTTRPTELGSNDRAELIGWISRRLGYHVAVPDLTPLGYRFLGGRLLAAVGGPAAMLMYADAAGTRVSVYVQPMRNAPGTPMHAVQAAGGTSGAVGGYVWIKDRIGYSVMAGEMLPGMHHLADTIRDGMSAAG